MTKSIHDLMREGNLKGAIEAAHVKARKTESPDTMMNRESANKVILNILTTPNEQGENPVDLYKKFIETQLEAMKKSGSVSDDQKAKITSYKKNLNTLKVASDDPVFKKISDTEGLAAKATAKESILSRVRAATIGSTPNQRG